MRTWRGSQRARRRDLSHVAGRAADGQDGEGDRDVRESAASTRDHIARKQQPEVAAAERPAYVEHSSNLPHFLMMSCFIETHSGVSLMSYQ
jgi:hypothetical protein